MSRYSVFEKYAKFFPKKLAKTIEVKTHNIEMNNNEWIPGEYYHEPKSFKKRAGNFLVYYEFQDPRPDEENYYYKNRKNAIDRYHYAGFRKLLLSDFVVKRSNIPYPYKDHKHELEPDLIKCPCCGAKGFIDHGWRVKCSSCDTWMESYGNSLNVWGNILRQKKTIFGTSYYHKNQKITEEEFNSWSVYYKLLTPENSGS